VIRRRVFDGLDTTEVETDVVLRMLNLCMLLGVGLIACCEKVVLTVPKFGRIAEESIIFLTGWFKKDAFVCQGGRWTE